ncbi:MAG TPA: elongation factor P [Candidatus Saccharimonadales bacterium]|nr:elongation factor P [Candidatus Saccharimonadales bacterium]
MAIENTDLKKGRIFALDDQPYKVIEYRQKVVGRGSSIVNVRIRNLISGQVINKTLKGNENIGEADLINKPVTYLYLEGSIYHFMDQSNFEQFSLPEQSIEDQKTYLKEGDGVSLILFNGSPIAIELPNNLPLKVDYTEDAVKGDTTSAITKNATLETGLVVKVPAFIKVGDIIRIDTRKATYLEREK